MTNIVEVKNLKAYYITDAYGVERTVQAVDDISLNIKEGEIYGIAGESGCGKSTLLKGDARRAPAATDCCRRNRRIPL